MGWDFQKKVMANFRKLSDHLQKIGYIVFFNEHFHECMQIDMAFLLKKIQKKNISVLLPTSSSFRFSVFQAFFSYNIISSNPCPSSVQIILENNGI